MFKRNDLKKLVFLSDVHFGLRANSPEWNTNLKDYFNGFFIPLLKRENADGDASLVVAGDWFDNRASLDISVMNTAIDIMDAITKICDVYMVIGNHDIYKKSDTDVNSLRIFEKNEKVHVIENFAVLELYDSVKCLLVSWVGDPKKETEIINKHKRGVDAIVLHTELTGMGYDNGRPIVNGVDPVAVGEYMIISGHIHTRQEKTSDKGVSRVYLGSPFHSRRSDIGNDKGVYVYGVKSKTEKNLKFVPNNYSPRFTRVPYDRIWESEIETGDLPFDSDSAFDAKMNVYDDIHNNYVDVIVSPEQARKINPSELSEKLSKYAPRSIEIRIEGKESVEKTDDTAYTGGCSVEDAFSEHISGMKLTDDEIRELERINSEYIKEANQ